MKRKRRGRKRNERREKCTRNLGNDWTFANFWCDVYSDSPRPENEEQSFFSLTREKFAECSLPLVRLELAKCRRFPFLPCALQIRWQMNHSRACRRNWASFITENSARRGTQFADIKFLPETITSLLIKHAELLKQVTWIMSRSLDNNIVNIMREILQGSFTNCKISFKEQSVTFTGDWSSFFETILKVSRIICQQFICHFEWNDRALRIIVQLVF